jgi:selT/selW/selH-like putative selenoprotein
VRGRGGIFDITVDGRKIYSKYDTGHFPTEKEIVDAVRKLGS